MKTKMAMYANRIEASAQLEAIQLAMGTLMDQGQTNLAVFKTLHNAMCDAINLLDENMGHHDGP